MPPGAFGGHRVLDGHIGPAAFERAQGAAQKVQLLVAADDDRRAVVPKLPQQKGGECVRALVQLPVGEPQAAVDDGGAVGGGIFF